MPEQPSDPSRSDRSSLSDALSSAAGRSAFGRVAPGETPSGAALLAAVGGIRGLVESILPGLTFLVVFTITGELVPSVLIPLAVGFVFVLIRAITRSRVTPALAGVIGIGVSALLALWTGRPEDNFVPGFFINGLWLLALGISLAVRWPLIGVIAGLLAGEGSAWRDDPAKRRVAYVATWLWIGMFSLRLAVQVPLYLAGATAWLAGSRLLMGVPLYAGVLWVTWLLERAVYARRPDDERSAAA